MLLKGKNTDRSLRGLITLQRIEMEEIWVEDTIDPGFFFKNQEGRTTHKAGKSPYKTMKTMSDPGSFS